MEGLLTIRVASEKLRVSVPTLRRMLKVGRLKAVRISPRLLRVEEKEIDRLIKESGGDAA